jgi:ferredoxin
VRIVDGAENLSPPAADELRLAARIPLGPDERFACCAHLHGPVTITTKYW